MKKTLFLICLSAFSSLNLSAQKNNSDANAQKAKDENTKNSSRVIVPENSVSTQRSITIDGKLVPYKATAGTLPVWDEDGKAIASLFYTYYERTDVQNKTTRPLVISFNGGPGSASVWMHIAYTGPVLLNIDDEGYPVQPYGYKDNAHSILDVADIVYVDPVNTGFSRIIDKDTPKSKFFGVKADISYLAEWISTFVTRNNRWASPKY
ncbi:MAG: carboxypeptidase, partial [Sphingobacteriaceae bacterium]|nr:carboxypeptidase [Sphingobacteriaceae bacterium]